MSLEQFLGEGREATVIERDRSNDDKLSIRMRCKHPSVEAALRDLPAFLDRLDKEVSEDGRSDD